MSLFNKTKVPTGCLTWLRPCREKKELWLMVPVEAWCSADNNREMCLSDSFCCIYSQVKCNTVGSNAN